jgi:hypothetical protein
MKNQGIEIKFTTKEGWKIKSLIIPAYKTYSDGLSLVVKVKSFKIDDHDIININDIKLKHEIINGSREICFVFKDKAKLELANIKNVNNTEDKIIIIAADRIKTIYDDLMSEALKKLMEKSLYKNNDIIK